MQRCILCGTDTAGSVGAAGIHWDCICQPCKDREDKALATRLGTLNKVIGAVLGERKAANDD